MKFYSIITTLSLDMSRERIHCDTTNYVTSTYVANGNNNKREKNWNKKKNKKEENKNIFNVNILQWAETSGRKWKGYCF